MDRDQSRPFDQAMDRIRTILGLTTQAELHAAVGVTRQSFSQAGTRGNIPNSWLKTLRTAHGLNPEWVRSGQGEPRIDPVEPQPLHMLPTSPLAREVRELRLELEAAGFDAEEIREAVRQLLRRRSGQAPYESGVREPGWTAVHEPPAGFPARSGPQPRPDDQDTPSGK